MAGYFIYSLDGNGFSKLTSEPTAQQAKVIAEHIGDSVSESATWPKELDQLTAEVKRRLACDDWYAGLSDDDAGIMDDIVFSFLDDETEKQLGIGLQCSAYGSIYWDCAELAAEQGVELMNEPNFGSSGFRFSGELSHEYGYYRNYSIFEPSAVETLHRDLKKVEPFFLALDDDGEGGIRDQFFNGLLGEVGKIAASNRFLFVQTDT